jgi:hypothetical protein
VGTLIAGVVAFLAGLGLAAATVVGVVQSQENAGDDPVTNVNYGTSNR